MKKIATLLIVVMISMRLTAQNSVAHAQQPKLVIGIVVDQMRYDYLYRFADKYEDGGFKRLLKDGFEFRDANLNYIPTFTGPGHAAIYTGTTPEYNGIIANDWYDKALKRSTYVTEDTTVYTIGSNSKAGLMSPKHLLSTTITDELRLSNNKQSRVIGISIKDRGAILPAGHIANAAYWFDDETGNFITSSYYTPALPQWVVDFNKKKIYDKYLSKPWQTLYPITAYTVGLPNGSSFRLSYKGETENKFPHDIPAIRKVEGNGVLRSTPFGNSFTIDFAMEALKQEALGKGPATDFLTLSLSSTDYVGHQFGINSIELQDTYARLDRDLARFFSFLDQYIGMDNVVIFLTADHGAAETPLQMQSMHIPAGVFDSQTIAQKLNSKLSSSFGKGQWVLHYDNLQFWLNNNLIEEKQVDRDKLTGKAIEWLKKLPGVYSAFNAAHLLQLSTSNEQIDQLVKGYSPLRSGDIILVLQPGWFDAPYAKDGGTTHGSGYTYDTHIPLIFMGGSIQPGSSATPVEVTDIAATLSDIMHIGKTNACIGKSLADYFMQKSQN